MNFKQIGNNKKRKGCKDFTINTSSITNIFDKLIHKIAKKNDQLINGD